MQKEVMIELKTKRCLLPNLRVAILYYRAFRKCHHSISDSVQAALIISSTYIEIDGRRISLVCDFLR